MSFESDVVSLRPRLLAYAMKLTKNRDNAEDLVQGVMLRAFDKKKHFKPGTNLSAWLFTIARNDFLSIVRKRGRVVEDPDDIMASSLSVRGRQFDTVALAELSEQIEALPKSQKQSLLLVAVEGLTYEECAEELGVAEGTIKSRVSRARKTLVEALGEDFKDTYTTENIISYDYYFEDHKGLGKSSRLSPNEFPTKVSSGNSF